MSNLTSDEKVVAFFKDNTTYANQARSGKLKDALIDFATDEAEVLGRTRSQRSKLPLVDLVLGEKEELKGVDLLREALVDEYVTGFSEKPGLNRDLVSLLHTNRLGLNDKELNEALSYIHGVNIRKTLAETNGLEAAHTLITHTSDIKTRAENLINSKLGLLEMMPEVPINDGPQHLLIKEHRGFIQAINEATKNGNNSSIWEAVNQYSKGFISGVRDPESMTRSSLLPYFMMSRMNDAMAEFGLGLNPSSLGSGGDILKGMIFQRLLPAVAAVEAWKYINYETDNLGIPSPNKLIGNMRANTKLAWSKTNDWERFVQLHPGSEYYLEGKSEEDVKEQLNSGYVPVRKGRFWTFGSRTSFYGDKIDYYAPDPYQTSRTNWQGAENADLNSKDYWANSVIPTPRYPLCLLPGTIVTTKNSNYSTIENINIGDSVLSSDGKWNKVTARLERFTEESAVIIHVSGAYAAPIMATSNHPILAICTSACTKRHRKIRQKIERLCIPNKKSKTCNTCGTCPNKDYKVGWIPAGELVPGDIVVGSRRKFNNNSSIDISTILSNNYTTTDSYIYQNCSSGSAGAFEYISSCGIYGHKVSKLCLNKEWKTSEFEIAQRSIKTNNPPIRVPRNINTDRSLGYLFGIYLAEGHTAQGKLIKFTLHSNEIDVAKKILEIVYDVFGIRGYIKPHGDTGNCIQVYIGSKLLTDILNTTCGHGAHNKHIPKFTFDCNEDFSYGLLEGLWIGDGCYADKRGGIVTISQELALDIKQLASSLGIYCSIAIKRHSKSNIVILGKESKASTSYVINFNPIEFQDITGIGSDTYIGPRYFWVDENFTYSVITDIETIHYTGNVYDIEVEDSHCFSLPSCIVHNSTLRHFLNPYQWEKKHAMGDNPDRPYTISGPLFTQETVWGPALNATLGKLIKPQKVLHPEYLPENKGGSLSKKQIERINRETKRSGNSGSGSVFGGGGSEYLTGDKSGDSYLSAPAGSIATVSPAGQIILSELGEIPTDTSELGARGRGKGGAMRMARWELERINRHLKATGGHLLPQKLMDIYGQGGGFSEEQLDELDFQGNLGTAGYIGRELAGIYGWMAGIPIPDKTGHVVQSAGRAYSYERKYWEAGLGGLGGFLCITPNTVLQNNFGITSTADNIKVGDTLLSRYGIPQVVLNVHTRKVDEDIRCISTYGGSIPLSATSEHPVLAIVSEYCEHKDGRKHNATCSKNCNKDTTCRFQYHENYSPEWISIKYLKKGDYVAYPIKTHTQQISSINIVDILELSEIKDYDDKFLLPGSKKKLLAFPKELELTKDLGKLFGFYLAEGSFGNRDHGKYYEVHFAFDRDEQHYAELCRDIMHNIGILGAKADTTKQGYWFARGCSRIFAELIMKLFGSKDKKHIPTFLLDAPLDFLYGMLEGIFRGDGHCRSDRQNKTTVSISIVAIDLATQIFNILLMLGYVPSIRIANKIRRLFKYENREYDTKLQYNITINGNSARKLRDDLGLLHYGKFNPEDSTDNTLCWSDNNFVYFQVRENYPIHYTGLVYDFTMDGDPSFCTQWAAIHNSEVGRRFMPHRNRMAEEYNPVPNSFEGSFLPGSNYFLDLQRGDPFVSVKQGEARLPGQAYEMIHGTKFMQTRASSLGKSVDEHIAEMLHYREPSSAYAERAMETGTEWHKKIQRAWESMGILQGKELEIYNEDLGISGHLDALLNINGREMIGEIKTMSAKRFSKRGAYDEHLDQLNFYMHETGVKSGLLAYINRDDPNQVKLMEFGYSPMRFNKTIGRVEAARNKLRGMVDSGDISRADLYDPVTRFEILADVAPYSEEYRALRSSLADNDQLTEAQQDRVHAAWKRSVKQKKQLDLHPYRFLHADVEKKSYKVTGILDANTLLVAGSDNPIRLAGVRASNQRTIDEYGEPREGESPAELLFRQFGIRRGSRIDVLVNADPLTRYENDALQTQHAVVYSHGKNINKELIDSGVGTEKDEWSAAGVYARFTKGEIAKGAAWERLAHGDTIFNTKFMKIRSPYEEYSRSQVYGKGGSSWERPIESFITPTVESYAARGIAGAAIGSALFGGMFFTKRQLRGKAMLVGAAVGAGLSLARQIGEGLFGEAWIPGRTQKRRDVEEYYDILEYIKYRRLYEHTRTLAKKEEGVDVEELTESAQRLGNWRKGKARELVDKKRKLILSGNKKEARGLNEELQNLSSGSENYALGPLATQALLYQQKYRSTMYGADPMGPFMNIFRALPKYEREIMNGLINDSTPEERKKAYRLLPDYEKRLLGSKLGIDDKDIPERELLSNYFKSHTLPGTDWEGWDPNTDLDKLKTRTVQEEHLDPMDFGLYPQNIAEAEETVSQIPLPTVHGSSGDIQNTLNRLLSAKGIRNLRVNVEVSPAPESTSDNINISMQLHHDRHTDLKDALNRM